LESESGVAGGSTRLRLAPTASSGAAAVATAGAAAVEAEGAAEAAEGGMGHWCSAPDEWPVTMPLPSGRSVATVASAESTATHAWCSRGAG
jgi:sarcosine oxidase gamma subunit